jgi:hypothetical protein
VVIRNPLYSYDQHGLHVHVYIPCKVKIRVQGSLSLFVCTSVAAHRDAAEESITGDSPVKQAYEETVDAA